MMLLPLDRDSLREQYAKASPFPFVKIENFLDTGFAAQVAGAYPSFADATGKGRTFKTVNEQKKVQVTDARLFPAPVAQLNEALASPAFISDLSYITSIPDLLADAELNGGGMHMTGPGGRLDVHVDFNYLEHRGLHRRLNLLLYLNPDWKDEWGGHIQLWDKKVHTCPQTFGPIMNRCVIFETSDISFHGVTPITTAAPCPRMSFAAYYYTREAPANWDGTLHDTVFKARPSEPFRRYVLMPAESAQRQIVDGFRGLRRKVKRLVRASP